MNSSEVKNIKKKLSENPRKRNDKKAKESIP